MDDLVFKIQFRNLINHLSFIVSIKHVEFHIIPILSKGFVDRYLKNEETWNVRCYVASLIHFWSLHDNASIDIDVMCAIVWATER